MPQPLNCQPACTRCDHTCLTGDDQWVGECAVPVAQVVAGINLKLQELVQQAQQVAASGGSSAASTLLQLRTDISKLAAVQQQDVVASITDLAAKFAADPNYDATVEIAEFSDVSAEAIAVVAAVSTAAATAWQGWWLMNQHLPCRADMIAASCLQSLSKLGLRVRASAGTEVISVQQLHSQ